jgi:hypothetical protein
MADIEVWKNTAVGMRWYICYNPMGAEDSKTVNGGRTFTLTTLERQVNQARSAGGGQDLFRNGTFILVRSSDSTDLQEFESRDAFTDDEIEVLVNEILGSPEEIDVLIEPLTSPVTLGRLYEEMVLVDAPSDLIAVVKDRKKQFEPGVHAVEREPAVTKPSR